MRMLLTIPAEDQRLALTLGALHDPKNNQFFTPPGADLAVFQPWLPANVQPGALATAIRGISLTELLSRVNEVVARAFPKAEWVRLEISNIHSRNGYMLLDVVDRDASGKELSKSKAAIWRREAEKIGEKFFKVTGSHLADGMKVLVLAQAQFNGQYGLSLNITDIDPSFTLGDMEARLKRIREKLEADGDADKNRNLAAPIDFSNVAVISPDGAAGLGDFQAEANRLANAGLCVFTYFPAIFQGEKAKESLKDAFVKAHTIHEMDPFDALVVIRGGGAAADLHWLNEYLVAKMVCRFRAPVFTGIGHERDSTILDEYAHRSFGTPSKVIAHIKEAIATRANKALEDWTAICQTVHARLSTAQARIEKHHGDIAAGAASQLDRAGFAAETRFDEVQNNALSALGLAAEKVGALHAAIANGAVSRLDVANAATEHVSASINDRARAAIHSIEVSVEHDFDAVTLAARRSIDGIEDHLDAYWLGLLDNATTVTNNLTAESDRNFSDVRFYARKMLGTAEDDAKELMAGILAHGVEPTLRRGFAIVKSEGKPISTKAAAATRESLEITFRDGSLKVSKREE
jgi:exodeoxyribonuclease VII large subunit